MVHFKLSILLLMAVLLMESCKKETPATPPIPINKPPVAHASSDKIILYTTDSVELKGMGTDTDGSIVSYEWNIKAYYSSINEYAYFNYKTALVKLKNLTEGYYWCMLKVKDDGGLTDFAEVILKVVSPDCPCYPEPCDAMGDPCNPWDY
jgi:hypothetical protein